MAANHSPRTAAVPSGLSGNQPMTFRSATAVIVWVLWLLFAVANWIDLAVEGRDHVALVAAAILLLVTGIGYVTAQRPRVTADDAGISVRNPLRDHRIGWAAVARVDLADLLRVHCQWGPGKKQRRVLTAWAVHFSRRRQLAAETRARRNTNRAEGSRPVPFGRGWPYASTSSGEGSAEEADALRAVRVLSELADRENHGQPEPPHSAWSWPAAAALVVPALILLLVACF